MRLLTTITLCLLIGLAVSAPRHARKESKESKESNESKESDESDHILITKEFFPDEFVVYSAKHDIVKILVPINSLNWEDDDQDNDTNDDDGMTVFFVEADIDKEGKRIDKGLYVLKDGKVKKLLDNGRDAAASKDDSKDVFFAAKDGIYKYNKNDCTAVKYGSVTDSLIGIAKENATDLIYVLTENHDLYKVSGSGEKKEKVNDVVGAREIVLDNSNNLYYYGDDNRPYVFNGEGVSEIKGLPEHPKTVRLLKPPFILENSVLFVTDNDIYFIYANGTSSTTDFEFQSDSKPTAFSIEAALIQYYGYNKKIYEYNVLAMVLSEVFDELKKFLDTKSEAIRSLSTRSRSGLHSPK